MSRGDQQSNGTTRRIHGLPFAGAISLLILLPLDYLKLKTRVCTYHALQKDKLPKIIISSDLSDECNHALEGCVDDEYKQVAKCSPSIAGTYLNEFLCKNR